MGNRRADTRHERDEEKRGRTKEEGREGGILKEGEWEIEEKGTNTEAKA